MTTATVTVSVYGKKAQVNPDNPSFSFHTGRQLPYIEVQAIVGDEGRAGWREKFKVTSKEVARQQIEEVLQFFNDTRDGIEKERKFFEFYEEPEGFDWIGDDQGMSGWLDPEGVFHPCGFGDHIKYALDLFNKDEERYRSCGSGEIEELIENQHISMSYVDQSTGGFISILGQLTPPQIDWFNRYFYKLAPSTQRSPLVRAAEEQGIKLKYHW